MDRKPDALWDSPRTSDCRHCRCQPFFQLYLLHPTSYRDSNNSRSVPIYRWSELRLINQPSFVVFRKREKAHQPSWWLFTLHKLWVESLTAYRKHNFLIPVSESCCGRQRGYMEIVIFMIKICFTEKESVTVPPAKCDHDICKLVQIIFLGTDSLLRSRY